MLKWTLVLSAAPELLFVPWYLKASRYGRSRKTLILKTVCSALFLCAGLSAYYRVGRFSDYAKLVLIGLLLGFIGDFLLHVSQKQLCLLGGLLSFLLGHVCYIAAFCEALRGSFPQAGFFDPPEAGVFSALFGAALIFILIGRRRFGKALLPVVLYAAVIALMVIKAGSLGLRTAFAFGIGASPVCPVLLIGAALFLISDALLMANIFQNKGLCGRHRQYRRLLCRSIPHSLYAVISVKNGHGFRPHPIFLLPSARGGFFHLSFLEKKKHRVFYP